MAGEVVDGGKIIAQFLLDSSQVDKGTKDIEKKTKSFTARLQGSFVGLTEKISAFGRGLAEIGEKFTFLGAAIATPLIMGLKDFASKGAEINKQIDELVKRRDELAKKPFSLTNAIDINRMNIQIGSLQRMNSTVLQASIRQKDLGDKVNTVKTQLEKLANEALTPTIDSIRLRWLPAISAWIAKHQELTQTIIKIAAAFVGFSIFGTIASVVSRLAVGLMFLIQPLKYLISPWGALLAVMGVFYYLLKDQLDPVINQFITTITNLWKNWKDGSASTCDSLDKLGTALWDFFKKTFLVVGESISNKLNEWTNGAWNAAFDWMVNIWEKVKNAVVGAWDAITAAFDKAKGTLGEWFGTVKGWFDAAFLHSWWTDSMKQMAENANKYLSSTTASFTRAHGALAGALAGMQGVSLGTVSRIRQPIGYKNIPVGRMVGGGIQNSFIIQPIYPSTQELVDDLKSGITKITDKHVQKVFRDANR